ncbi:MAG: 3'-5' exonuclease [Bacilli bacterium]
MRKLTKEFKEHYRLIYDYSHKASLIFTDDYVVLDLETTGLDPVLDKITEIGLIRVRNRQVVDSFSQLVNPGKEIPSFIEKKTAITNEMVKDMPSIYEILPQVRDFIGSDYVVGHNIGFDLCFLNLAMEKINDRLTNPYIDTFRIVKPLIPKIRHRLCDIISFYHIENTTGFHRALTDVINTSKAYEAMKDTILENFSNYEDFITKPRAALSEKGVPLKFAFSEIVSNDENNTCSFTNSCEIDLREINLSFDIPSEKKLKKAFAYGLVPKETKSSYDEISLYLKNHKSHLSESMRKDSLSVITFSQLDVKDYLLYRKKNIEVYNSDDVVKFIKGRK